MKYSQLIIFYFSGTGNAKNAALWFESVAKEKGLETHLVNIDRFEEIEIPKLSGKTLIGFFSPTHGFNLPPIMLKFILKFPRLKQVDVFILNTRGGFKLNTLFVPGLSGLGQIFPALVLRMKGFRIVGMQPLDLPSNWLLLHPGIRKPIIDSIYARCNGIVNKFANRLLEGRRKYKAFLSLPFDLAIMPVSILYYFFGRFFLAKTLVATSECNACELCVEKCPVKAIELIDERPYWSYTCESCMRCVNICPKRAIETAHAFSIALLVISSLVITPLLFLGLEFIGVSAYVEQSLLGEKTFVILKTIILLLFVFFSYRTLHFLMRYKFVNKLVSYTSFSKFKFWRRYKAPKTVRKTV